MSVETFARIRAREWILSIEGSEFTDDPADSGGATRYGITQAVYVKFFPGEHVRDCTPEKAWRIYQADYWAAVRADELPPPFALAIFDFAVNSGPASAIRRFQLALNAVGVDVDPDGVVGPRTIGGARQAAREPEDVAEVLADFLYLREEYQDQLIERRPKDRKWRKGWRRRLFKLALVCGEVHGGLRPEAA